MVRLNCRILRHRDWRDSARPEHRRRLGDTGDGRGGAGRQIPTNAECRIPDARCPMPDASKLRL